MLLGEKDGVLVVLELSIWCSGGNPIALISDLDSWWVRVRIIAKWPLSYPVCQICTRPHTFSAGSKGYSQPSGRAVWVGGLIFLGYEHKNWPFVAKSGHAARRSILQVGDFQTAHWAIFVSTGRLEPQTAQWGVCQFQVGGSVVRIPHNVRNFWILILAGVVTFLIFCSKIPFISVSYWRR